jgi:hypothetical protein
VLLGGLIVAVALTAGALRYGTRSMTRPLVALVAVLGVAILVLGFNPYVTNTVRHRSPFHPVAGPNALDIGKVHTGRALRDKSGPERVVAALVGRTDASGMHADPKVPFTFEGDEWDAFEHPNVRIGGFGPLFSGVFLLAAAAGLTLLVLRVRNRGSPGFGGAYLLALAGGFALSVLVLPDAFLARFSPQLWFVPLFVLVVALQASLARALRVLAAIGLVVALVNALGVGLRAGQLDVRASRRQDASLTRLAAHTAGYEARFGRWIRPEARRLTDAGVRFRQVRTLPAGCTPLGLTFDGQLRRVVRARSGGKMYRGVQLCPREPRR